MADGDYSNGGASGADSSMGSSSSSSAAKSRWKDSKSAGALRSAGSSLSSSGSQMLSDSRDEAASHVGPVSYKKGGRVKKTGLARLHKGEYVVPRKKVKRVKRAMKRMKARD